MGLLRVALALAVFLSHLPLATVHFVGGGVAVQGFFIVSGFYMSLVLGGKYADTTLFYSNRALRIFPGYAVMMVVAALALFGLAASATASPDMFVTLWHRTSSTAVLAFENLALLGQELLFWFTVAPDGGLVFDPTNAGPTPEAPVAWQFLLVPQAWSLSIELTFYALAPYLARRSTRTLVLIGLASVALRLAGHWLPVSYALWQGRLFPTALFLFIAGMLSQRALPLAARLPRWVGWIANAALLAVVIALPLVALKGETDRWILYATIALAAPFVFHAFGRFSIDRFIGDLSYPIYLTHLLVIGLVLTYEPEHGAWVALAGTVCLSLLLLLAVDHPVDRWRQARLKAAQTRPIGIEPAVATVG